MRILPILFLVLTLSLNSFAQDQNNLYANTEMRLRFVGEMILSRLDDSTRWEANTEFCQTLENILNDPGSFSYPFDQVPNMAVLTPKDSSFRIFNWNFPSRAQEFTYFGYVQVKDGDQVKVFKLIDQSDNIPNPTHQTLSPETWLGVLYYQLVQTEFMGKKTYTLLGWDGHDLYTNKKIIDVISFENGTPVFGKTIFPDWGDRQQKRIIFEYGERTSMSVKYNDQAILEKQRKQRIIPGESMYNYTSIPSDMISFNRLEPLHPELEGDFRYYIARSELVDGFVFENGYWRYYSEVDARNRQMQDTSFNRPQELKLFPDSLK